MINLSSDIIGDKLSPQWIEFNFHSWIENINSSSYWKENFDWLQILMNDAKNNQPFYKIEYNSFEFKYIKELNTE